MKCLFFKLFAILISFLSIYSDAQANVIDKLTGEEFPSEVSFNHDGKDYRLKATGVATRKKFFVKVYSVAHYLQEGAAKANTDSVQDIMQDHVAKQLTMKWLRTVDPGKIQEGYQESFKNTLSEAEHAQLKNEIDQFVHFFNQEAKKGDVTIIRWIPKGYIEVLFNDQNVGSITNPNFAKALWGIWFGDKSVVDRNNLISLMK